MLAVRLVILCHCRPADLPTNGLKPRGIF